MFDAAYWIEKLALIEHPEGGFYKESYRSNEKYVFNSVSLNERNISTAIYFLMEKGNFSAFHRIKSDEIWHFYAGGPLEIFVIDSNDVLIKILLGPNPESGETLQACVPANSWFGSRPLKNTGFSLVGCTVSPGFDFDDFEMAKRSELIGKYPNHIGIIEELTRE